MTKKTIIFCLVFTFSLFSASFLYADTAEVLPKGVFLGEIKTDGYPINFKNCGKSTWKASPLLGEANQYVFRELLGMKKASIQSYIDQGIIA